MKLGNPPRRWENLDEIWGKCTLCGQLYHPKSNLTEGPDGKLYCSGHYYFRWAKHYFDEAELPHIEDEPDDYGY